MREPPDETQRLAVLLVEDNPGDVRLVREGVATVKAQVDLQVVRSGTAAIEFLTGEECDPPSLVLLDLNLPGKPGFDVLQAIRDGRQCEKVPVVVVSSSKNTDDVRRAYDQSANAYVTKPADPDEYIEMVATAVRFWTIDANRPPTDD